MNGMRVGIGIFVLLVVSGVYGTFHAHPAPDDMLATVQDVAGQVLVVGFEGVSLTPSLESELRNLRPAGVLLLGKNIQDAQQLQELVQDMQNISMEETGIPLVVAVDQEGGIVSRIPWVNGIAQSALRTPEEALVVGRKRGEQLRDLGINMNLSPVLDGLHELDFLFPRSFQKDEASSVAMAASLIAGQREAGVISVAKHVPGYDGISRNPEKGSIPLMRHMPHSLVKAVNDRESLPVAMLSHAIYEDTDTVVLPFSAPGIANVRKMIPEAIIMSDDLASDALLDVYGADEIGVNAVKGGVDILLVSRMDSAILMRNAVMREMEKDSAFRLRVVENAKKMLKLKEDWDLVRKRI